MNWETQETIIEILVEKVRCLTDITKNYETENQRQLEAISRLDDDVVTLTHKVIIKDGELARQYDYYTDKIAAMTKE